MPDQRPTRVRWQVLAILTLVMIVTALGRLNLGIAAQFIQDEFRFTTETMGWILGAFAFGYALFQIPWGWAGDRYGPRATLAVALTSWGVFTVLMSVLPALWRSSSALGWSFALIRLCTGAGEAGSYPNANKIVAWWMPARERGLGSSLLLGGVGAGGMLAPLLFAATNQRMGWRWSFVLTGILALMIAGVWFRYSTDRPQEHPKLNSAELEILGSTRVGSHSCRLKGTPWRTMLSRGSVWALILSYLCHGYTPYIYFTWFFLYLTRVRGLTIAKGAFWGSTPFLVMTLMSLLGGWASDRAVARLGRRRGRQRTACVGMTISALLLLAGSHATGNVSAVLLLSFAAGFSSFAAPSWWATCIDLTPNYSGSLSGLMNTCANIAGGVAPILTARIAMRFGWTQALDFAASVSFAAGLIWLLVNADSKLETGDALPARHRELSPLGARQA